MRTFYWHRFASRRGVRWELWDHDNAERIGSCMHLSGSKRFVCHAAAPAKDGKILYTYQAGTAAAARRALEREWDARSIGLFGVDQIQFETVQ